MGGRGSRGLMSGWRQGGWDMNGKGQGRWRRRVTSGSEREMAPPTGRGSIEKRSERCLHNCPRPIPFAFRAFLYPRKPSVRMLQLGIHLSLDQRAVSAIYRTGHNARWARDSAHRLCASSGRSCLTDYSDSGELLLGPVALFSGASVVRQGRAADAPTTSSCAADKPWRPQHGRFLEDDRRMDRSEISARTQEANRIISLSPSHESNISSSHSRDHLLPLSASLAAPSTDLPAPLLDSPRRRHPLLRITDLPVLAETYVGSKSIAGLTVHAAANRSRRLQVPTTDVLPLPVLRV